MPHRSAHARPVVLVLSGLVVAAGPVWGSAQIRAGGDGRALDANPGVGSGGTNRIENAIDFQARNDLVTNNVAGGFGFQDDVSFLAPGEFQDQLGSDDLQTFRQESLLSAPNVANLNTRGQILRAGDIVVFDSVTTVPSNRVNNVPTRFAPDGGSFRVGPDTFDPNPFQITINRRPDAFINTRFDQTPINTVGFTRQADGSALAVTVDPLTGVSRRTFRAAETRTTDPRDLQRDLYGLTRPTDPINALPRQADRIDLSGATPTTFITPQAYGGLGQQNLDGTNPFDRAGFADATGRIKPTLQLGQLATNPRSAGVVTLEQRVQQIQESIFGPTQAPGTQAQPGTTPDNATPGSSAPGAAPAENAYTKLLDEIRAQAEQTAEERAALRPAGLDTRPAWMKVLDIPTDEQVDDVEDGLAETLARIRNRAAGDSESTDATQGQGEDDERRAEANAKLNDLMDDLSYNVRLETLVAEREGRLSELFRQGEEQLAEGKFLNAERTYRQIRLETGENPLGQAGLIHAQLGGGMVRSAAFNLRSLFEAHPELIATRYGQNLLPPAERLEWLQKELQRMIDSETSSVEPGLMLAYLGYQVESRQLVRYGLAIAEEASPLDPLLPVLRRIWLDQKPAAPVPEGK
ncbi:MAG: hypothetical protein AAF333_05420 [Planctomycetota bacterium]